MLLLVSYIDMTIEKASLWLRQFCQGHQVILGSSSQWRRKVLSEANCQLAGAMDPNIDEKAIRDLDPERLVITISNAKADALIGRIEGGADTYLICTDQVAVCDDSIREKPESEAQAREFIKSYSEDGLPVRTCAGVVVVHVESGRRESGTYWNSVWYKSIPKSVVDEIVHGKVVYTCCGGFSVDCSVMGKYVDRIEGEFAGVMGMPLTLLEELFKRFVEC